MKNSSKCSLAICESNSSNLLIGSLDLVPSVPSFGIEYAIDPVIHRLD
jgi:hypothetical protein